jgi:hypothetical protein
MWHITTISTQVPLMCSTFHHTKSHLSFLSRISLRDTVTHHFSHFSHVSHHHTHHTTYNAYIICISKSIFFSLSDLIYATTTTTTNDERERERERERGGWGEMKNMVDFFVSLSLSLDHHHHHTTTHHTYTLSYYIVHIIQNIIIIVIIYLHHDIQTYVVSRVYLDIDMRKRPSFGARSQSPDICDDYCHKSNLRKRKWWEQNV